MLRGAGPLGADGSNGNSREVRSGVEVVENGWLGTSDGPFKGSEIESRVDVSGSGGGETL